MKVKFLYIWLCCFGLYPLQVNAQPEFTARVSNTAIGINDMLEASFEIQNGKVEQFEPPRFASWDIMSGPNIKTSSITVNGQRSTSVAYTYLLRPGSTGKLIIPATRAVVDGKALWTRAITVTVTRQSPPGTQNPLQSPRGYRPSPGDNAEDPEYDGYMLKPGEDAKKKIADNLFLKVELDKKTCFEGEALVADYLLYSRVSLNARVSRRPSFNGFSSIDLQENAPGEYDVRTYNGKKYKVYRVRKVQLYPLQHGTLTLEPVEIDAEVQFRKLPSLDEIEQYDIRNPGSFVNIPYTIKSELVSIDVSPLPEAGKPAGMQNAVGKFSITAKWNEKKLSQNQAGALLLQITGEGNWPLVRMPAVQWPKGLEVYEPSMNEVLDSQRVPVQGSRTYKLSFVPGEAGTIEIPEIKLPFFNPATKSYEVATAALPTLIIEKSAATSDASNTTKESRNATDIFSTLARWAFPAAAILLLGILFWRGKPDRSKTSGQSGEDELHRTPLDSFSQLDQPVASTRRIDIGKKENEAVADHVLKEYESLLVSPAVITEPEPAAVYDQLAQLRKQLESYVSEDKASDALIHTYAAAEAWLYSPLRTEAEGKTLVQALKDEINRISRNQDVNL